MIVESYTSIFRHILPKDIEYTDGTTVSWNEYSATRRIFGMIFSLGTTWWIYYFSINILLNQNNYAENFFISQEASDQLNNILVNSSYISAENLRFMNILYYINVLVTIMWIVKALFEIRIQSDKYSIKFEDLKNYIEMNSFKYSKKIGKQKS